MHALITHFRRTERSAFHAALRAIATTVLVIACAERVIAQQQAQPTTASEQPSTTSQTSPLLVVPTDSSVRQEAGASLSAEAIMNAAAQAASALTGRGMDPNAQAPATLPSAAPRGQPRPNPFTSSVKSPAGSGVFIPANKSDPKKVVVEETDGLVSLMVREGSLRQVVAMIAETQKLNIVFAGPADSLVTASFDRQPWQKVLDALLSASGHTWSVQDHIIFISSIENADYLPPGAEGRRVQIFELDFASASDIDQTVKGLLSPAGTSWLMESQKTNNRRTRDSIAVCDYPAFLTRISQYIAQADQPPRQVYIETHILQVNLDDTCRSGVNFQELMSLASGKVRLTTAGFASQPASPTLPSPFPPTSTTPTSPSFFIEADGTGLDALIELLKTTTDTKTLASPKIHAVSGQESHIQIGGQIGYRVTTTTQTSTNESVQFLDVGVVLRVTPQIARDGRILMRIHPEVSTGQLNPETNNPEKETTEVETDVLVSSGQGIVIGGLIQETDNTVVSKIPLLGEIPYLGILFQKRQVTRSRQEIIVTLQPHVLPYSPCLQERLDHEFVRTALPLTEGAIFSYPRPFEYRLPDVFDGKGAPFLPKNYANYGAGTGGELTALPPVDAILHEAEADAIMEYGASEELYLETLPAPEPNPATP